MANKCYMSFSKFSFAKKILVSFFLNGANPTSLVMS